MSLNVAFSLEVAELDRLLHEADPSALLVSSRLLRRIIKHDRKLSGPGLLVPHRKCHLLSREALLEAASADDLGVPADRVVPPAVILIARPEREKLAAMPRGPALIKFWRLLFHARVHRAIEERVREGKLTLAGVRARVHRIGLTEYDEIRSVLRQEYLLLPPQDEITIYGEFAALFLELHYFAPAVMPSYFPAIADFARIVRLLEEDVDGTALFQATRLVGAPDPRAIVPPATVGAPLTASRAVLLQTQRRDQPRSLLQNAVKARAKGNVVRAAIQSTLAVAGADQEQAARARAATAQDLAELARRLGRALHLSERETTDWREALTVLVEPATAGTWPAEARLLYDLQKVCLDHERAVFSPDVIEWAYSRFQKPLVRPLPNQPLVLIVKHLRRAVHRLTTTRLSEAERRPLERLLREAVQQSEERLRDRFRPLLEQALDDVHLRPGSFVERVARQKLVEELLDRIAERGLLTMGDVRDAISRNNLKLPDLASPVEFFRGDPLIRANRRLADSLAGVYRRGEFYLRWLQRLSSVAFGTQPGRFVTYYFILPLGAAYVALEGVQHLLDLLVKPFGGEELHLADKFSVLALAYFFLGVFHIPTFRTGVGAALLIGWRAARGLLWDLPAALVRLPLVQRVLESRPVMLLTRYGLKPALFTLPVWLGLRRAGTGAVGEALGSITAFLAAALLINSRLGRIAEEISVDVLMRNWHRLHRNILPGLFRWILDIFKLLVDGIERGLYSVDEWLRFQSGESRFSLVAKTVLGFFWFYINYVIRFCVNLLIEPQLNPIKHFPVVTVSHKLLLPLAFTAKKSVPSSLAGILLNVVPLSVETANAVTATVVWGIPGIFGFLVWELKENWRLYEANRAEVLRPVAIGHHGETMGRLLKPGFHSGTLPRLWSRMRRSERRAQRTGNLRGARRQREALHHLEACVRHFVERELLPLINASKCWRVGPVHVGTIELASNRIRIELRCATLPSAGLQIAFEEQSGWLVASIVHPAWLVRLTDDDRTLLRGALAGIYKLAGVELLRPQIEASLGPECAAYDIADEGLVVWPGNNYDTEVVYDLNARTYLSPRVQRGQAPTAAPVLRADRLFLSRHPIAWADWATVWEHYQTGQGYLPPLLADVKLFADPSPAAQQPGSV